MGLNQWRNTDTVIEWFESIRNKHLCKFVGFDIREFYPSITENLLKKALTFAETHTHISFRWWQSNYSPRKKIIAF